MKIFTKFLLFLWRSFCHCGYRLFLLCLSLRLYVLRFRLFFLDAFLFFEEVLHFFIAPFLPKQPMYGSLPVYTLQKIRCQLHLDQRSTIVDFGSGKGKLALFFSLMTPCQVIGFEQYGYFYRLSCLLSAIFFQGSRVRFELGDYLENPVPGCDVAFLSPLDCSASQTQSLVDQFVLKKTTCISIGAAVSGLVYHDVRSFKWPCSWGFSSVYLYSPRLS